MGETKNDDNSHDSTLYTAQRERDGTITFTEVKHTDANEVTKQQTRLHDMIMFTE